MKTFQLDDHYVPLLRKCVEDALDRNTAKVEPEIAKVIKETAFGPILKALEIAKADPPSVRPTTARTVEDGRQKPAVFMKPAPTVRKKYKERSAPDTSRLPSFAPALIAHRADGVSYAVIAAWLGIEKGVAKGYVASTVKLWKELQDTPHGQARYDKLKAWFPNWSGYGETATIGQIARIMDRPTTGQVQA